MNLQRTILLVAAALAFAAGGYTLHRERALASMRKDSAAPAQAAAPKTPVIRFVKDPEPAPKMEARDLDGKPVNLADTKGKVVVVNFWATWCPPCREEIPEMIELQKRYKDKLVIIGVSEDDDPPEKVQKFAVRQGMNYPIIMYTPAIVASWGGVPALPTSFILNTDGRVMARHTGLKSLETYDMEVRSLLNMPVEARVETFVDQGEVFMKNAANATELPDVDLSKLTPEQKKVALHRLNAEACTCGCMLTMAECRINDTTCPVSKSLAADVVNQVRGGKTVSPVPKGAPGTAPAASTSSPKST